MKKYLLIALAVVVLAGGAGVAWWKFGNRPSPMEAARSLLEKGDVRAALIELRNAVRNEPDNADAHFQLGMLQLRMGDPIAAEKELKSARSRGITASELPLLLAQSYLQQRRNKELLAEFQPPLATPALSSELLLLRSYAQLNLRDTAAAQASLDEAERLAPNSPNPPMAAARVAMGRRDLDLAGKKVEQALALDPRRPDVLLLKAQILNLRGDRDGALAALNTALSITPKMTAARLERANLLISVGDDAKAKQDVDAVLADQPNSVQGTYLRAVLLTRANDFAGADLLFEKLSTVMARLPRGFYFQAVEKYNLGQTEQAIDAATRYIERSPTDPNGIKLLARILLTAGRFEQAQSILSRAVQSGMSDPDMVDLMGRAYAAGGRPGAAVQAWGKAAAIAPNNADILSHLGAAKLVAGDPTGAEGDFNRSLQLDPSKASVEEAAVMAALAAGDIDKASSALDALRKAAGDIENVQFLSAELLEKQQRYDAAGAQFEKLLATNPKLVRAKMAYAQLLLLQGRAADASRQLTDVLQIEPANATALAALLQIELAEGHAAVAVTLVEAALKTAPNDQTLILTLSDLYIAAGTPAKSIALLDSSVKPDAKPIPTLLLARARAQLALKQNVQALETYRKVAELLPKNTEIVREIAVLQVDAKDFDGARRTLRDGLITQPADPNLLHAMVGVAYLGHGEAAALDEIKRLQADPANKTAALTLLPDFDISTRNYQKAAQEYTSLLQTAPSSAMLMMATRAYIQAGEPAQARDLLHLWLSKQPRDMEATRALASLDISNKQLSDALPLLEAVVQRQPNDAGSLNNLAWIYAQQNNPKALETARRAFDLVASPQSADTLGWILATHGDAQNALPLLLQAAAAMPTDPSVQFHLATALNATGKKADAIKALTPLAARTAPFDEQPAARQLLADLQAGK